MSENLSVEDQENFMYSVAMQRYMGRGWPEASYSRLRHGTIVWLKEYVGDDMAYYEIRHQAHDAISKINGRNDVEDVDYIDMDNHYNAAEFSYLSISRDVATQVAIIYFEHLRDYLKARETGDQKIDEIRQQVATSAHLLLRQIETIIPNFPLSDRTEENRDYVRPDLNLLIDFDRISRESGFVNVFTVSNLDKFEAIAADENSLGVSQNTYSGLRPIDILHYLNSSKDVALYEQEGVSDPKPFTVINVDGTVDIDLEREVQMTTGLDMAIETISDQEQKKLVEQIIFSSQATPFDNVDLTKETLARNDLLPKWMVHFGDTTVYLTDKLFTKVSEKKPRPNTIIYIEDKERGLVARSCYKSRSQTVWRLLPAYRRNHFHKGHGEEQLTLTPEIQRALNYLCKTEQIKEAEVVFYGAAKNGHSLAASFQSEIKREPITLGEGFFDDNYSKRPKKVDPKDPESFKFDDEEDKPDFSGLIDSWTEENDLNGLVTFELFESKNSRLRYLFCRDTRGRAWITGIDLKDAKMTSQGIKEQWVRGGDLCTPVFEYWKQAGGYANSNFQAGEEEQYYDMYKNYLSHIPIIQEYQASVATRAA
jgi:hypothetical protein